MANLITQAEYARRRGVSREAVRKAVATKRISLIDGKIDPQVADIQWERNTDHDQAARSQPNGGFNLTAPQGTARAHIQPPSSDRSDDDQDDDAQDSSLLANKIRIAAADAETKEDALKKSRGELVPAAQVQKVAFTKARMARDMLSAFPARVAPLLVGKSMKEIELAMREEVRKVIEGIAASESESHQ